MTNTEPVTRTKEFCHEWGVRVLDSFGSDGWSWYRGPVHGGIVWEPRVIVWPSDTHLRSIYKVRRRYYSEEQKEDFSHFLGRVLLHELSHLVHGVKPPEAQEVRSEMLAFEWYAAEFLGLQGQKRWYERVSIRQPNGSYLGWHSVAPQAIQALLTSSLVIAQQKGLLDDKRKPTPRDIT